MNRPAQNKTDERRYRWIGAFWLSIVAGVIVLGAIQTASDDPSVLHSWNGALTAGLLIAVAAWFVYVMWIRARRNYEHPGARDPRQAYALVLLGVVLACSLVVLHGELLGLLFAVMGMSVFVIDGWASIVPVTALGLVFLYVVRAPRSATPSQIAGDLLSYVSTVAIVYTLALVMKQRWQRDRLIVELRTAHDQLQDAHQQLSHAHAHEMELAALRERNRLAREMHDSLGHALVLIAIKIEAAQRLQSVDPERASSEWEETKALVRSTMADLRHSLAGLRAPALEEQPFREALVELGSEIQRNADIAVTTDVLVDAAMLDRSIQENVYRIVQEALANVARHAHAGHAWVQLRIHQDALLLTVSDDGIGLSSSRATGGHYGVTGMKERVDALGGILTLGPRNGGGTEVSARIPLKERADARHSHPVG